MRGNVDTRLRKLREREYDAIVLARAGLDRLGVDEGEPVETGTLTPAPGQGCLALEGRSDDEEIAQLAGAVTDRRALVELTAERAVVTALDATCHTPVGAHARLEGDRLAVEAYAGLPDGIRVDPRSGRGGCAPTLRRSAARSRSGCSRQARAPCSPRRRLKGVRPFRKRLPARGGAP